MVTGASEGPVTGEPATGTLTAVIENLAGMLGAVAGSLARFDRLFGSLAVFDGLNRRWRRSRCYRSRPGLPCGTGPWFSCSHRNTPCSRRILRAVAFCLTLSPLKSTPGRVMAVFQSWPAQCRKRKERRREDPEAPRQEGHGLLYADCGEGQNSGWWGSTCERGTSFCSISERDQAEAQVNRQLTALSLVWHQHNELPVWCRPTAHYRRNL